VLSPTELAEHIRQHLHDDKGGIAEHLTALRDADVAEVLNALTRPEAAEVLTLLAADRAASLAAQPTLNRRGALFAELEPTRAATLLDELPADQRTEVLRQMCAHDRQRLLPKLTPAARAETEQLLSYPDRSAGAIMTTEFVRLDSTMSIADALKYIRGAASDLESIYACYVLDPAGKLMGAASLRDLVVADPNARVADMMRRNPITVKVTDDRDEAARKIGKYNLLAVPVLEADGQVVGFVTVDDVIDVMIEEQTNQVLRLGGVEAGALDDPYLATPFLGLVRKRAVWLVILFLSEMFTATAMGYYEDEIAKLVVLATFIPLVISAGGNTGSQAASLLIRALALREVRLGDWWRVFRRELASGLMLGGLLGMIGFLRIAVWTLFTPMYGPHWALIGATVGISLVGIVTWGTISGSMLPFILKKCGADPATSSAPFVATLVDVTGLVIYFSVAMVILRDMLKATPLP
jgi:magnesium transporter